MSYNSDIETNYIFYERWFGLLKANTERYYINEKN